MTSKGAFAALDEANDENLMIDAGIWRIFGIPYRL
jgi:hypothetical protein